MNKKQKKTLERILIAVALVIVLKLLPALPMAVATASNTWRVGSPSTAVPLVAACRPKNAWPTWVTSAPTRLATVRTKSMSLPACSALPLTARRRYLQQEARRLRRENGK